MNVLQLFILVLYLVWSGFSIKIILTKPNVLFSGEVVGRYWNRFDGRYEDDIKYYTPFTNLWFILTIILIITALIVFVPWFYKIF